MVKVRITKHAKKRLLQWRRARGLGRLEVSTHEEIERLLQSAVPCEMNNVLAHRLHKQREATVFLRGGGNNGDGDWRMVLVNEGPDQKVVVTIEPNISPRNMGPWGNVPGVSHVAEDPAFTLGEVARHNAFQYIRRRLVSCVQDILMEEEGVYVSQ